MKIAKVRRKQTGTKKLTTIFAVMVFGFILFTNSEHVLAQDGAKGTENTADKNLKSSARINPSTLAMEFSIPLAAYPGRGGNAIPISYSYSSKVWQMEMFRTMMMGGGKPYRL